ncbi:shugoshin [Drosophila eugracilis]|uniref:shugoshin n=1 Tax=Drosophila eugracilis TaxID=29029 RepID=UPI0007E67B36|nr:shugoshin [Drosophila eugracilis]
MVNEVEQYKLLNAELMDQVQKQRMEIGEYRKQVIILQREIMDMREEHILQNDRQRQENICIIKSLMQRLNIDSDCLVVPQEPTQRVSKPPNSRRSSKEICKEIRRTCALARTTRTTSPRKSIPMEISSISIPYSALLKPQMESTREKDENTAIRNSLQPRRPTELMFDEDESDEDSSETASPEQNNEAQNDGNQNNHLFSIIEETVSEDEDEDSSSSCEAIYCDTTIESSLSNERSTSIPRGRALREVNTNVPEAVPLFKGKDPRKSMSGVPSNEDSIQEPSIQQPRLAVTRPSNNSVILPDIIGSTPRRSMFNSIYQKGGSTSTPKSFIVEEETATKTRNRTAPQKKSIQTDMSSSFFSTSGRPSRRCKPTSLAEPNLRIKMRNEAKK